MSQCKHEGTRIPMNIKMSLHTAAAEDQSVRYEQRDQEREWESALELNKRRRDSRSRRTAVEENDSLGGSVSPPGVDNEVNPLYPIHACVAPSV